MIEPPITFLPRVRLLTPQLFTKVFTNQEDAYPIVQDYPDLLGRGVLPFLTWQESLATRQGANQLVSDSVRPGIAGDFSRAPNVCSSAGRSNKPDPFQANPLGRGRLADFLRCSLLTYRFRYARRSRLENQPTDRRRYASYL